MKAVLAGNSSLFLIFGIASATQGGTNAVHVLDIDKWEWQSSIPAIENKEQQDTSTNGGNGYTYDHPDDKSLIIGPSIGIAVAVLLTVSKKKLFMLPIYLYIL